MTLDTESMSPARRRYVEQLTRVADFLDAMGKVADEHGLHIEATAAGELSIVENDAGAPPLPIRFAWDHEAKYQPVMPGRTGPPR